jgi:hypothetical protein
LGGNPGSFGYWAMSNTLVGTTWVKVSGYISGFGGSTGQFRPSTKFWTPQALFNYQNISGNNVSYISGWKVIKVGQQGNRTFRGNVTAPIYYDTNQAYFGDFGSEIRMPYQNGGTMRLRTNTHWDSQSGIDLIGGQGEFRMSSDTGNLNLRVDGWIIGYDYLQSLGAVYGTIYYDQNNTGYYTDPASYSNLNEGNFAGRMWYSNYLVSRNSGGLMGDYNVTGTSPKVIWTIGESWPLGNMYGLG